MISRPDLYPDEKLLSYSKYYYIDPDPLHPLAAQILRKPLEKEDVLWPEDVKKMFSPGYQDAMLGYYLFDGGSYSALYAQLNSNCAVRAFMLPLLNRLISVKAGNIKKSRCTLRPTARSASRKSFGIISTPAAC